MKYSSSVYTLNVHVDFMPCFLNHRFFQTMHSVVNLSLWSIMLLMPIQGQSFIHSANVLQMCTRFLKWCLLLVSCTMSSHMQICFCLIIEQKVTWTKREVAYLLFASSIPTIFYLEVCGVVGVWASWLRCFDIWIWFCETTKSILIKMNVLILKSNFQLMIDMILLLVNNF